MSHGRTHSLYTRFWLRQSIPRNAEILKKAGDNVDVLTVDSKTPAHDLPKSFMGFPIEHTLGFTFPLYNQISLTFDLPEAKGAAIIERRKPDLIHVTSPGFLLFAAILYARINKIPLVMSYHTHLPSYGKNYLSFIPAIESICWELLRLAHNRADLTLCTSPQMKQELTENGIQNVEVWRKGIDTERFHPKFKSMEMRSRMSDGNVDDFLMVYVGRLGAEKRLKDVKAMLRKCQMPDSASLARVRRKVNSKNGSRVPRLYLLANCGDDLSAAFASADAFVMPSDSETLGFVVLESMASGVPVVGAAAGGIPDLIDNGKTSYLCPPGDTDAFVSRLSKLQQDKPFREALGKAARTEAERWGWEAATSVLRNVQYTKAMRNFRSRAFEGYGKPRTVFLFRLLRMRYKQFKKAVGKFVFGEHKAKPAEA
ncbi:Glycosyltransferase Family 4 [Fragilaria crotonensis]|nr:Glycosyltransferase Family 4 [Fragilaria crotonensis]